MLYITIRHEPLVNGGLNYKDPKVAIMLNDAALIDY
jgi:hypothetical protein